MSVKQLLLLPLALCSLLDWNLTINDRTEYFCTEDACSAPAGWDISWPALIIVHQDKLHIKLTHPGQVGWLTAELYIGDCLLQASLNKQSLNISNGNQSWPVDGDWIVLEFTTQNCTMALTRLTLSEPSEPSVSSESNEKDENPMIAAAITACILLIAIAVSSAIDRSRMTIQIDDGL